MVKPYHERVIDMKFLKITAALILSSALLLGCQQREDIPQKSESSPPSEASEESAMDGIIWWNAPETTSPEITLETLPSEENGSPPEPDPTALTISGWNYKSELDDEAFSRAAALSGLGARFAQYGPADVSVKIMAGDKDVDIYVVTAMYLNDLIGRGLCLPMKSDIIDGFNAECFDYISELCRDENGNTVAMPIGNEPSMILYPVQAAEEVGFMREDIAYMEDFHRLVESYGGKRVSYASWAGPIYNYLTQYNCFVCDFKNKKADYDTELFREIYGVFGGWNLNSYALDGTLPAPKGFVNPNSVDNPNVSRTILDSQNALFLADTTEYYTLKWISTPDPFAEGAPKFDINDWRAAHIPWISKDVGKNLSSPIYAVVNPYSEHFDEAVKALEYIAENFYSSVDPYLNGSPFLKKDISDYPESYMPDTQIFKDAFEIAENGCVALAPSVLGSTDDFINYQSGRVSLDEAIEIYSRQIDAYLNE